MDFRKVTPDTINYINVLFPGNTAAQNQKIIPRQFFTDPLKDIYKTLFKYKKMPRVELRYNLREQVKNMKSDVFKHETNDISKTRWPKTHHRIFHDQKIYSNEKRSDKKATDSSKATFFHTDPDSYTSKYFKRDLRRSEHSEQNDQLFGIDGKTIPDKGFSIETLIENLIGNSFEGANDTKIERKVDLNNVANNTTNNTGNKETNTANKMCIYSMNLTNENRDENLYLDDGRVADVVKKWSNYTFSQMIAALSKQIDIQNNTSMEMVKRSKDLSILNDKVSGNVTRTNVTDIIDNEKLKVAIKESTAMLSNTTNDIVSVQRGES
jgi:hypothetical protein